MKNLKFENFENGEELKEYFEKWGRGNNFTANQLQGILNFFEECDMSDTKLDVIGVCCSYSGYKSVEEACKDFDVEDEEELEYSHTVIPCPGGEVVVSC